MFQTSQLLFLSLAAITLADPCLKYPAPDHLRCGVPGKLTKPQLARQAYLAEEDHTNLAGCAYRCKVNFPSCQFFTTVPVRDGAGINCFLYDASGDSMGAVRDEGSEVRLWNMYVVLVGDNLNRSSAEEAANRGAVIASRSTVHPHRKSYRPFPASSGRCLDLFNADLIASRSKASPQAKTTCPIS